MWSTSLVTIYIDYIMSSSLCAGETHGSLTVGRSDFRVSPFFGYHLRDCFGFWGVGGSRNGEVEGWEKQHDEGVYFMVVLPCGSMEMGEGEIVELFSDFPRLNLKLRLVVYYADALPP